MLVTPLDPVSVREDLARGAEYVVYAIEAVAAGTVYYYVWDLSSSVYPIAHAADRLEVVDARRSALWPAGADAIEAWASDDSFYLNLVEGDDGGAAREVFAAAKAVMDMEFVIPSELKGSALRLGDGWLECTGCEHIWHAEPVSAEMCLCARCLELLAFRERSR